MLPGSWANLWRCVPIPFHLHSSTLASLWLLSSGHSTNRKAAHPRRCVFSLARLLPRAHLTTCVSRAMRARRATRTDSEHHGNVPGSESASVLVTGLISACSDSRRSGCSQRSSCRRSQSSPTQSACTSRIPCFCPRPQESFLSYVGTPRLNCARRWPCASSLWATSTRR